MKAIIPACATIAAAALLGAVACGASSSSGIPVNPVKSYGSQVSEGPTSAAVAAPVETTASPSAAVSSHLANPDALGFPVSATRR